MPIVLDAIFGSAEVGVLSFATDKYAIVPHGLSSRKKNQIAKILGVKVISASIGGTYLIGPLLTGNSYGLIISQIALDEEVKMIKRELDSINITVLDSKLTAVGNLILVNDKGAIVSPDLSSKDIVAIGDALDVDVVKSKIAGRSYVGSIAIATNTGAIVHIETSEEEEELIRSVLKVPCKPGTVNNGITFVRSGIVANTTGAIVGARTTGPELMVISSVLGIE